MELEIYHLKNCDTCKKAIKALQAAGHELKLTNVRADGISTADLKRFIKAVGYETLMNTRSTTWRGLDERYRNDMNEAQALALMAEHPTLIKRPVIVNQDQITVGWTKDVQAKYL